MEMKKRYTDKELKELIEWVNDNAEEVAVPGARKQKKELRVTVKNKRYEIQVDAKRLKNALSLLKKQKAVSVTLDIQKKKATAVDAFKGSNVVTAVKCEFLGIALTYEMPSGAKGTMVLV